MNEFAMCNSCGWHGNSMDLDSISAAELLERDMESGDIGTPDDYSFTGEMDLCPSCQSDQVYRDD